MSSYDLAEFESILSLDNPIKSSVSTRWERKSSTVRTMLTTENGVGINGGTNGVDSENGCSLDRYIPNRSGMDFENCQHAMNSSEEMSLASSVEESEYSKLVKEANGNSQNARVLAFKNKAPAPKDEHLNTLKVLYTAQGAKTKEVVKPTRHISSAPVRILDAPDMLDDYYLNLISWGSSNVLAVALSQTLYLWDASTCSIKELMSVDNGSDDYISSVSWIQQGGSHIAVGTASNTVQLWDVNAGKMVRSMNGHSARVGCLAWNQHILTSGSKDTTIINHDVRIQNHLVDRMTSHTQEVCGLAWSQDGVLASGANDNTLCIYDTSSSHSDNVQAKFILTDHQASVKALAWSPHERNLLASGGGTADRTIKFWNTLSGSLVNSIDTGSQVCALQWSPFEKEILSSHGYAENQLCLWKYPTMAKVKELKGHSSRVLHLATSPDGSLVCSGAADETLRFWNVFASEGKRKNDIMSSNPSGSLSRTGKLCLR